jgi:competence protein ComEA
MRSPLLGVDRGGREGARQGHGSGELTSPSRAARALAALAAVRRVFTSATWMPVTARVAFAGGVLLLLAGIGRSQAADTTQAPVPLTAVEEHGEVRDAGAPGEPAEAVRAPAAPPSAPCPGGGGAGGATEGDPVYLNDATESDLRRLPGVGAKRADAILELRRRVGRFSRLEQLLRVKGVGRKTLKKWRPFVRLEARPAPAPVPAQADADAGT